MKKIICLVLALVMIFSFSACGDNSKDDRKESQTPGEKLDIGAYLYDVESNEVYAQKKYLGNRYYVIGTIKEINAYANGTEVIVKDSDSGESFGFAPYDDNDILGFRVGDKVKATGTLTGFHFYSGSFNKSVFDVAV